MKMAQGVFQLEAAAADVPLDRSEANRIFTADLSPGFRRLVVYDDLASHDGALGLLAALAQASFNQCLIQAICCITELSMKYFGKPHIGKNLACL